MGASIGYIGIGAMGGPMAKNLIKAGFDVIVYDLQKNLANSYYLFGRDKKNFEYISRGIELFNKILPIIQEDIKTADTAQIYQNLSDSYKLLAKGTDKNLVSQSLTYTIKSWDLYDKLGQNESAKTLKPKLIENLSLFVYLEANTGNTAKSIQYLTEFLNTH